MTPFWAEYYFGRNIGMWGVQSAAVERPAHTALLQSIWNDPAGKKGQKLQFEWPPRTPNLQLQLQFTITITITIGGVWGGLGGL